MAIKAPVGIAGITGTNMLKLRTRLSKSQTDFWAPVGITQSGGSRYESGRPIPKPARIAIAHTYEPEIRQHARAIRMSVKA